MLEVAHLAIHVGHLTGRDEMRSLFRSITETAADLLHLDGYGLEPGCHADLVVLQAGDAIEAIRLRATRLYVIRRGKVISRMAPSQASLDLGGETCLVDFLRPPPDG